MTRPNLHLVEIHDYEKPGLTPEIGQALARAAEHVRAAIAALEPVLASAREDAHNPLEESSDHLQRALWFLTYDFDAEMAECMKVPS
jgi:hypothetical protein